MIIGIEYRDGEEQTVEHDVEIHYQTRNGDLVAIFDDNSIGVFRDAQVLCAWDNENDVGVLENLRPAVDPNDPNVVVNE